MTNEEIAQALHRMTPVANQRTEDRPLPLSYGTENAGNKALGIASVCCALIGPSTVVSYGASPIHNYLADVGLLAILFIAWASSVVGLCLSIASLRRQSARNGWAISGLVLSGLALCFNCIALIPGTSR